MHLPHLEVSDLSVDTGMLEAYRTTGRETDSGRVLF